MKKTNLVLGMMLIMLLAMSTNLMAGTRHVTNTDDTGEGSLRYWVENSLDGDEIVFDVTGLITLTSGYISWTNENKSLTITGPGADQLAIDGNNNSRIWYMYQDTGTYDVSISGLTFQNGYSTEGSALHCRNYNGQLNITNCTLVSNQSPSHIYSHAIYNDHNLTLTNCTISNNTGGIMCNSPGVTTLKNCTISGNTDDNCGGIMSWNSSTINLTNCTITDNTTTGTSYSGGVTACYGDILNFKNCIIAGNSNGNNSYPDIQANSGSTFNSLGYNLIGNVGLQNFSTNTTGDRYGDPNNTTTQNPGAIESDAAIDPKLRVLELNNNPYRTKTHCFTDGTSPAIDNGTNTGEQTDQRGASIYNGTRDIGAYEWQGSIHTLPVTLSTFTAQFIENTPTLYWTIQSETDNMGWFVYRNEEEDFTTSQKISEFIEVHGTTTQQQTYIYEDQIENPEVGDTYYYWLESIDYSGMVSHYDKVAMLTIPDIHNPDPHVAVPRKYGLQSGPNPFNSNLTVSYMLPQTDMVRIEIYNMYGQLIAQFNEGLKTADRQYTIDWDGKDLYGQNVASGVLLIKLITSEDSEAIKAILLR